MMVMAVATSRTEVTEICPVTPTSPRLRHLTRCPTGAWNHGIIAVESVGRGGHGSGIETWNARVLGMTRGVAARGVTLSGPTPGVAPSAAVSIDVALIAPTLDVALRGTQIPYAVVAGAEARVVIMTVIRVAATGQRACWAHLRGRMPRTAGERGSDVERAMLRKPLAFQIIAAMTWSHGGRRGLTQ